MSTIATALRDQMIRSERNGPKGQWLQSVDTKSIKLGILIQSSHFSAWSLAKKGHGMVFPKVGDSNRPSSRIMYDHVLSLSRQQLEALSELWQKDLAGKLHGFIMAASWLHDEILSNRVKPYWQTILANSSDSCFFEAMMTFLFRLKGSRLERCWHS